MFPGDLRPGDVIVLPDGDGEVVVVHIRLGRGGFLITVSEPSAPASERVEVLTTWVPVTRRRVLSVQAWPELPRLTGEVLHEQPVPARRHTASS